MENPYLAAKESFTFQKRSKKMLLHQRANPSTRERTLTGTSSILAGSKSRVLPTDAFFTKYNYRAGRAVLTVIS